MPNHVLNVVTFNKKVDKIKAFVKGKGKFDFNKILPMPEALKGDTAPLRQKEGETKEQYGERINDNIKQYGHSDWYEWSTHNWGTKWNAYDIDEEEDGFQFNTAWASPWRVMQKLKRNF